MGDAVHKVAHEVEGTVLDGGAHGVGGVHGADDDRPLKGALAVLHAGGLEVGHDGEVLPDLALKTVLCKLLAEDRVGLADSFETVTRDGTGAADTEARTGEGLTEHHAVGQAELLADDAHFVLEEDLHRLDELELHVLRETARIVVRLDAALALKNIGPDRTLREKLYAVELARFLGKDLNELIADDLALLLGISDSGELIKEAVSCVDIDKVRVHLVAEDLDDLLGLALAQKAVVDVDADELLADGLDEQRCNDGGVNTAGEGEENLLAAYLLAQFSQLFVDKGLRLLRSGDPFHGIGTSVKTHNLPPGYICI